MTTPVWIEQAQLQNKAQRDARAAINRGEIYQPDACQSCGSKRRTYAHHDDYREPLVVRFLCARCHGLEHKKGPWLVAVGKKPSKPSRSDQMVAFYQKVATS
jgi:ribosomal protein S27AE